MLEMDASIVANLDITKTNASNIKKIKVSVSNLKKTRM
jgi:hypothetical protein